MIDADKLYRGAMLNARLQAKRNLRAMMKGQRADSGPPLTELERRTVIRQIERAYEMGVSEGLSQTFGRNRRA